MARQGALRRRPFDDVGVHGRSVASAGVRGKGRIHNFVNGDDWADFNLANLRFAYSRSGSGPANEQVGAQYRITALGALSTNYDLRYQTGTLTVIAP